MMNRRKLLSFLMSAFQAIAESKGNPQVIYPLFRANLHHLNEELIPLIITWHQDKFAAVDEDEKQFLAAVVVEFANLIQQFPLGNRSVNLEIAIDCYQLALAVYTRDMFPEDWARTQINLAIAYSDRIRGDRAENIEDAIAAYQLALSVYTRAAFPEQWATTQMNLAIAYRGRIRGDRAQNIEEAIACYQLALSIYTYAAAYPEEWAMIQNNLATAYYDRIRGDRSENIERAISCYQQTLSVYTREAYPKRWAGTQNNLAVAYYDRIRGDRSENIERAIACYQLALEVRTRTDYPEDWATTQMNLAGALQTRIREERAQNIEDAIACYQLALEVYTRAAFPEDWARTQMNLANAYCDRIRGERAENIERAIECYWLDLEVRTRTAFPEDWARTQMNLATAYCDRIRGERTLNIEEAIECCQQALSIYTYANFPERWAGTQMNLANAYNDRIQGERAQNIKRVIECYQLALSVYTRAAFPERWAGIQNNLAILYTGKGNDDLAIDHYQQALEIYQPTAFPINALNANGGLGNIYFRRGEWQQAIDTYDLAITSAETSRSWSTSEDERQRIIREAISVYANTIQAYINLGQIDKAIVTSERARSRQLVDLMDTPDLYQDGEIPDKIKTYLEQCDELDRQIHARRFMPNSGDPTGDRQMVGTSRDSRAITEISTAVAELEAQKRSIYAKMRALDPRIADRREVVPIDLATIQSLIKNPNTAILSFYTTNSDTHIFIITPAGEPQIHTCQGQGLQQLQVWLMESWLDPYLADRSAWRRAMPNILTELAQRLELDALISKLEGIAELVIMPHLYLHQIPFMAIFPDKFTIRYAPSCQILKYCADRSSIGQIQHGTIENADGTLPGAEFEGMQIAELFQVADKYRLRGRQQATIQGFHDLMKHEQPITNLHLAHHAISRLDNPRESALNLVDGNITLDRLIASQYPHLHEVVLSCCETHLGLADFTDDILTLATGFLCAGARTVIGTLWAVDDLATALFSIFYYQNRYSDRSRAESLKMAQVRLRNLTGEDFRRNYRDDLETHLLAYARANRDDRVLLQTQLQQGEIDQATCDRERNRLTEAYNNALELIDALDGHSQADRPFAHPNYWAAFTCQGLA